MGLFDSYFDPEQFQDSGGLLGRLLSLQQQQGQPDAGLDPQVPGDGGQVSSAPQMSIPLPMPRPASTPDGPSVNPQTPDYGQTRNIAVGNYQMPQFGTADLSQAIQQPSDVGDRLTAGFQSWAHTPIGNPFAALANGIAGLNSGQRTDSASVAPAQIPTPPQSSGLGDHLIAGFQGWAHTPVGNPFAALANGIAGVNTGQRTDAVGATSSSIQAPAPPPGRGDRLSAGLQSWARTPVGNPIAALTNGMAGLNSGPRTDPAGMAQPNPQQRIDPSGNPQDLSTQYQALRPVLGDHDAMLAVVHPEVGRTLIAQALAGRSMPGNTDNANPAGNDQAGPGNEASPTGGSQPPGLSKVGHLETPTNPNQALGELQGIQERNSDRAISGTGYMSAVRDGNVTKNSNGGLDVTNGTVVTFSYTDGHAKTVTVTNTDVAHIDAKTGEVVIQKSL